MTSLRITPYSDVPAATEASTVPGILDGRLVEDALESAQAAMTLADSIEDEVISDAVKKLAWAVDSLAVLNRNLLGAIYRGNISVKNYPALEDGPHAAFLPFGPPRVRVAVAVVGLEQEHAAKRER